MPNIKLMLHEFSKMRGFSKWTNKKEQKEYNKINVARYYDKYDIHIKRIRLSTI